MDAEDLAWNQRGLLGPGQRRTIEAHVRSYGLSQGELFAAVIERQIYRAYAAPRSGRLLAIEPARRTFRSR